VSLTLPPLVAPSEIDSNHVLATGVIYVAYQLEQLRVFSVTDRIAEMFQQDLLPVGRTAGAHLTHADQRSQTERIRTPRFARTLGCAGDAAASQSNREFAALWKRFIANVAAQSGARSGQQRQIRKSGHDLAVDLSLYGEHTNLEVTSLCFEK
jgi:hypothetical protein